MRFDLHCHTTASDGVLSPADLVRRAAEEMQQHGSFAYASQQIPDGELSAFFADRRRAVEKR